MTALVLLDVAIILVLARIAGTLLTRIGQPAVIGELSVGILLGPTLFDGALPRLLLPPDVKAKLSTVATIGLVIFMFAVGRELNRHRFAARVRATVGIAAGSILVPFGLGMGMSLVIGDRYTTGEPLHFALFVGIAMAVTALPVLARILADRDLVGTRIGVLAISGAAAVDAVAWTGIALLVTTTADVWRLVLVAPYVAGMIFGARTVLGRLLPRLSTKAALATVAVGLFLSSAAAEWLGLHHVMGALLFGVALTRRVDDDLATHLDELVRVGSSLLLPIFFVIAASGVDLSDLGLVGVADLMLVLAVAVTGKIGGTLLGARVGGVTWADGARVAVLMNARGVTEIVVLQLGLQTGLLDVRLYSLLVIMALVTTALTGPLLQLMDRRAQGGRQIADRTVGSSP
jgi:Kef-type K+ transport system membrane component KefB